MLHHTLIVVDDHKLFSAALADLINKSGRYQVLYTAENGGELADYFRYPKNIPDIVLLDINMPVMNGAATANWLRKNYPEIKTMGLSMNNDESSIVSMFRNGAKGYLLKDAGPEELFAALDMLCEKGFYHSEFVSGKLLNAAIKENEQVKLTDRETIFLHHACSELTYKEIADKMNISMRTVDGYREALFEKLHVKSRVGLVLYAITQKLVLL